MITEQVVTTGPLLLLDHAVRDDVTALHRALLPGLPGRAADLGGHLLSDLGDWFVAYPVLLTAGAAATLRSRAAGAQGWWRTPAAAVGAGMTVPALVAPAKWGIGRPGPLLPFLLPHQSGWYPSGHTTTATVCYGTAALLAGWTLAARWARRALAASAALLSLGVGLGLVWCAYHWMLDVVAAWCLSGIILWSVGRWMRPGPGPG